MADIYLLIGLTLPPDVAHESVPAMVSLFVADCWPGMSRTQMVARAKRRGLRLSVRAVARCTPGSTGLFELLADDGTVACRMLAQLRRGGARRGGKRRVQRLGVSRPPPRDPRQTSLF
jgi:hypothetical protein